MDINLERLLTFAFASVVAWKLLGFLLGHFSRKLDCIKDSNIEILKALGRIEDKMGGD